MPSFRFAGRVRRFRPLSLLLLTACAGTGSGTGASGTTGARSAAPATPLVLEPQTSGTATLLQAVSAVNDSVAWVSGHNATYARTTDGGRTWHAARVPGVDSTLQFRDVHALDARTAWLMSAGPGEQSRIYHTTDAGATWTLQFTNREPDGFYDCMAFWDARRGAAYSDAVNGRVTVITTDDGGATWNPVPATAAPAAQPGEGGFASSGTCLVAGRGGRGWIATGNAGGPDARSRVLRTEDYGQSWTATDVPVAAGEAAGLATITFLDDRTGAALGGLIAKLDSATDNVALTSDGGRTWRPGGRPSFPGAVFGAAYVPRAGGPTLVAVSPKGASVSYDGGTAWARLDTLAYWGIGFAPSGTGWITGPRGRITRIRLP